MIHIVIGKRSLHVVKDTVKVLSDTKKKTIVTASYLRPTRTWGAKKKAVAAGIIALFVWVAFNALVMTDIEDTKPTVSFLTQGQP